MKNHSLKTSSHPIIISLCAAMLFVAGCQPTETKSADSSQTKAAAKADMTRDKAAVTTANSSAEQDNTNPDLMASTRDKSVSINWQAVDSGVAAIDPANFNYPFKLDSNNVKAQVEFSNISAKQAQHNLTLGMVSNEPIEKIVDQLGDSYLSHSFSPEQATLFIYTTPNVAASQHDYVVADEFARGLVLPIVITSELPASSDKTKTASAESDTHSH
ncbi:hypothetical protein [Psychrobacter lutiphocae]|uniref:hypothetical protein n=1 Tax=Psychrobacter lutiphocae TaxID=540500 RepID=UPI00036E4759|nr:hypothetical protein [Psychrobacter lutiphocae]